MAASDLAMTRASSWAGTTTLNRRPAGGGGSGTTHAGGGAGTGVSGGGGNGGGGSGSAGVLSAGAVFGPFGVVLEAIIEGQLGDLFGRRRMERRIAGMSEHVIVCGWRRVGVPPERRLTRDAALVHQAVGVFELRWWDRDWRAGAGHPHETAPCIAAVAFRPQQVIPDLAKGLRR